MTSDHDTNPNPKPLPLTIILTLTSKQALLVFSHLVYGFTPSSRRCYTTLYYSQFSVFCSSFRSIGTIIFKLHRQTHLSIQERLSKKKCSKSLWKPPSHGRFGSFFGYNFSSIGTSILKMSVRNLTYVLIIFITSYVQNIRGICRLVTEW